MRTRQVYDASGPARAEAPLAGRRVLLVEDEALVALDLEMTLQGEGAEVVGPFARLGPALDAADESFDLAVLDISLGPDEVFPLARKLAARGVPFLFHSGHGDPARLKRDFPGARVCAKPCPPREIVASLLALAPIRA